MKYISLRHGLQMPIIGLGTGKLMSQSETESAVKAALSLGYRSFDTAYRYCNEDKIGNALRQWVDAGQGSRKDLFIVTKLPAIGMHEDRVEQFLNLSLKALQVEYIDLYLVHWPIGLQCQSDLELNPRDEHGNLLLDETTNLETIWISMEQQVKNGKCKAIGLSNYNIKQIQRILKVAEIPPEILQVEVNVYFQQTELRAFCQEHGISVCAYSPLGSPGRGINNNIPASSVHMLNDPVVMDIARKHSSSSSQVLLRFLIQLGIAVIPKSSQYANLKNNIDIFDFQLDGSDMQRLTKLDKGIAARNFKPLGTEKHPEYPF